MNEFGVGLVGYGLGGRVFHAPFIQTTNGLSLRAVVSRDEAKVRRDLPGMTVVPTVEVLLEDQNIALVVISSPDAFHADHAIAALHAGKHVLVDKPLAPRLHDAHSIAEVAIRTDRMLTVFHNRRWDADFLTLQGLLADGTLGRIVHFESHFDRWRPAVPKVWKEERDGGSWQDLGPHLVDQTICLFGKPDAVTATITTLREGAKSPDWFHAILHYPQMHAVLQSSKLAADNRLRFAVHGTGGSWIKHGVDTQEPTIVAGGGLGVKTFGLDPLPGLLTFGTNPESAIEVPNRRGNYALFWTALEKALRGDGPNPVPASEALTVMEVLDAGLRSNEERKTISL